jgi:hypothetical protein
MKISGRQQFRLTASRPLRRPTAGVVAEVVLKELEELEEWSCFRMAR